MTDGPSDPFTAVPPQAVPPQAVPPPPPALPPTPRRSRTPVYVALFIVAVLSGSALFVSGFTLGLQQSLSPGTAAQDEALFGPFWEAWNKIRAEFVGTYQPADIVQGAIKGMFTSLGDPYSSYMTAKEYSDSLQGISGQFEGIGAQMANQATDGSSCTVIAPDCPLVVTGVVAGSPAEAGGLQAGDQVVAVDGVAVEGSTLTDTVGKVRGARGTQVRLSILRAGVTQDLTFTRDVIKSQDVTGKLLADGSVGYLKVSGFSSSAADDFQTMLKSQLDSGAHSFVIDLRDDPGGYVDAALSIASQFISSGPIYWEQFADGRQVPTEARSDGLATDPATRVVVLVNGGSASASEIVSGALQDTGRAELVGTQTFGKGTVQQWHLLSGDNSGGFRLSIAKWLTPDKRWIHGVGLTPDVVVPIPDGTPAGQDPQLDRALAILASGPAAGSPSPGSPAGAASPEPSAVPGSTGITFAPASSTPGSPAAAPVPTPFATPAAPAAPTSSAGGDILVAWRPGGRTAS